MRFLVALLVAACGCSSVETQVLVRDASPPDLDADIPETGVDSDTGIAAPTCPGAALAASCYPSGVSCAGGHRYTCLGGVCPTGDMGPCALLSDNHVGQYDVCCERVACVRSQYGDQQCQRRLDGTPIPGAAGLMMWTCPWANGKQFAKAPGSCMLNGLPAPDATSTAGEYCCR